MTYQWPQDHQQDTGFKYWIYEFYRPHWYDWNLLKSIYWIDSNVLGFHKFQPISATKRELPDHFSIPLPGRLSSLWAQRSLVRDLQISVLVATWTLILSLPVIVWPWAEAWWHLVTKFQNPPCHHC
jgi:hypothetical protein